MKLLVTTTVDAPSQSIIQETKMAILTALEKVKDRTKADMKIGSCNAENTAELQMMMGQIKWFSLGKEPNGFSESKRQAQKKKTLGIVDETSIEDELLDL